MRKGKILSTRELVLCALFSALTAVGAYIRIPLPMLTLTLQFFFTNLAALLLGREVRFMRDGAECRGLALDIDAQGCLLLREEDGTVVPLRSGEVHQVRPVRRH